MSGTMDSRISTEELPQHQPRNSGPALDALPTDRLELVEAWGMNASVASYVYRPSVVEDVAAVFDTARRHGVSVGLRGAGCSYGDASLIAENICLDLTRMTRILAWNPETGVIDLEPGVTFRQLWQYVLPDGWWPPVVPGTMYATVGGAAAMNIHGKNNFRVGPIGDHVVEITVLLPDGSTRVCSRTRNADLFVAAIGGFGMLGCIVRVTLQLKRIHSGKLEVSAFTAANFGRLIDEFEARLDRADYLVAWVDCFAKDGACGRALAHQARHLEPGEDNDAARSLQIKAQELPGTLLGVVPKSVMWRLLRPLVNNPGMRLLNAARYRVSAAGRSHKTFLQSHAGFAFLLDYVPNWKLAYKPGGLIQYQSFVPAAAAEACFTRQMEFCDEAGIVPYLGVFKRHRRDDFLMSHAVDGYSLALDFPVRARNRGALWSLAARLNELVLEHNGRFYFAKDSTLDPETARAFLGADTVDRFFALKQMCDPENLLQTELARRLFPGYF